MGLCLYITKGLKLEKCGITLRVQHLSSPWFLQQKPLPTLVLKTDVEIGKTEPV